MPHAVVTALAAKAIIAKTCTAALLVGASGAAFVTLNSPEQDDLGSVSVEYAPGEIEALAFAAGQSTEGILQVPTRYDGEVPERSGEALPGDNRDGWNGTDNNPADNPDAEIADKSSAAVETADDEPAAEKPKEEAPKEEKPEPEPEADKTAPELKILYPADGSHHDNKVVVFEGVTEPGAEVMAGKYAAKVDAEGNWRIELVLSPGANGAQFAATDKAGNTTYGKVTVWLDVAEEKPAEPKPKETEEEKEKEEDAEIEVEFYAKQKYGTCDAETPYEKFWGTATPNTLVEISSPYGSGVAEVSKHGHWEIKVYFPNAPRNEPFTIKVSAANGSATFSFVAKSWEEPKEEEPKEGTDPAPEEPKHDEETTDK